MQYFEKLWFDFVERFREWQLWPNEQMNLVVIRHHLDPGIFKGILLLHSKAVWEVLVLDGVTSMYFPSTLVIIVFNGENSETTKVLTGSIVKVYCKPMQVIYMKFFFHILKYLILTFSNYSLRSTHTSNVVVFPKANTVVKRKST